jgi:hypothetical protein
MFMGGDWETTIPHVRCDKHCYGPQVKSTCGATLSTYLCIGFKTQVNLILKTSLELGMKKYVSWPFKRSGSEVK